MPPLRKRKYQSTLDAQENARGNQLSVSLPTARNSNIQNKRIETNQEDMASLSSNLCMISPERSKRKTTLRHRVSRIGHMKSGRSRHGTAAGKCERGDSRELDLAFCFMTSQNTFASRVPHGLVGGGPKNTLHLLHYRLHCF
jgi:hypothetical protein